MISVIHAADEQSETRLFLRSPPRNAAFVVALTDYPVSGVVLLPFVVAGAPDDGEMMVYDE